MRSPDMNSSAEQVETESRVAPDLRSRNALAATSLDQHRVAAIVIFSLLVIAIFLFAPLLPTQRFGYDEADYMYAVSKGFRANYLDEGAISALTFVKKGLEGLHSSDWSGLSKYIRKTDDITFYRHYHGPLYFYSILMVKPWLAQQERSVRVLNLATLLMCAMILFVGALFVVPEHAGVAACLSACFLLVSPNNLDTVMWVGPHTLYTATSLVALFFMAKLVQSNQTRHLYASVVAIAIAFTAIEYAVLLLVTLLVVVAVRRKILLPGGAAKDLLLLVAKCAVLFLATIAVLWPAAIFKLTLAKDYLFFAYFAAVRSATSYGTDSLAHVWWLRVRSSPLEFTCLVLFAGIFVSGLIRKTFRPFLLPFAIYAALMFLTTVRNHSLSPVYVSSMLPPLYFIGAVLLVGTVASRGRPAYALLAVVVAAFAINGYLYAYRPLSRLQPDPRTNGLVEVLDRAGVRNSKILMAHDYLPTAHYYFPSNEYVPYADSAPIDQLLSSASQFDGLLYEGPNIEELKRELQQNHQAAPNIVTVPSLAGRIIAYVPLR